MKSFNYFTQVIISFFPPKLIKKKKFQKRHFAQNLVKKKGWYITFYIFMFFSPRPFTSLSILKHIFLNLWLFTYFLTQILTHTTAIYFSIFHIVNSNSFRNKKKKFWFNNKWYWWLLKCLELGQKVGSKCTKCIDQSTLRKASVSNQWKGTLASGTWHCYDLHLDPLWQPSSHCYILYCIYQNLLMLCKNSMSFFFKFYFDLFTLQRILPIVLPFT